MNRREFARYCAGAAACGAAASAGLFRRAFAAGPVILDSSYLYDCPDPIEFTEPGPIILPGGACRCGWSRGPLLTLNFEDAHFASARKMRLAMKKWDMYHIYTPDFAIHFLTAWTAYAAFFTAFVYDRKTKQTFEGSSFLPPSPEIAMMRDSTAGRTEFSQNNVSAVFVADGEWRRLAVDFPGFAKGVLSAEIGLFLPSGHESMAASHTTNPKRCHYGHKINCMTARGWLKLNGATYDLDPRDSFGALDFGRGHYPPKMFWYWATASGKHSDGKLIGFNLGFGNKPDNVTENALFYNGALTKIGATECLVPPDDDLMQPWIVRDTAGMVDLTYTPENVRRINVQIGTRYSRGRTTLGTYSGKLATASGEVLDVKDLFGLYEWVDSKW